MVIQNSLKILKELSELEKKISEIENFNSKTGKEINTEELIKIFSKQYPE